MARDNSPKPCAGCSLPITWASSDGRWVPVGPDGYRHECPNKDALKAALRTRYSGKRRQPPPSVPQYNSAGGRTDGPPRYEHRPAYAPGHPDEPPTEAPIGFAVDVTTLAPERQTLRYHGIVAIFASGNEPDEIILSPNDGSAALVIGAVEKVEVRID